jgi:hypothetical protein
MKIEIKRTDSCLCCRWFSDASGCRLGRRYLDLKAGPAPDPDCKPGVYVLVPEGTMRILRAEVIPQALENAAGLAKFEGQEMEARAREWAAMYVREAMDCVPLDKELGLVTVNAEELKALRELAEAIEQRYQISTEFYALADDSDDAPPLDGNKVMETYDKMDAANRKEYNALSALRALGSPEIPDNSTGGGK